MARLRKFCAYRKMERPNTRTSKYRVKNFVRAVPHNTIVRYEMGDPKAKFDTTVNLISKTSLQIRHNAIESARQTANKLLETTLGKNGYFFKILMYPYHILRENPLASGAGADRMSTGMAHSFGKPISLAAQVKAGKIMIEVKVDKKNVALAKQSLKRASYKLPCASKIVVA